MKRHLLIAAVMTPFLMLAGYSLTDWYLNRDRTPAALNRLQPLAACTLQRGCTLISGDFTFKLQHRKGQLSVTANQRLKGVLIEVVDITPPQAMTPMDSEGYRWVLTLPPDTPGNLKLRWVAQSHWRNYIGEWP